MNKFINPEMSLFGALVEEQIEKANNFYVSLEFPRVEFFLF